MSDLTEEQLEGMDMWGDDREVMFAREHQAAGAYLVGMAVAEIRRRRAEQAAGRDHVERVVVEEIERAPTDRPHPAVIARRVADRLTVPVLSEEDQETLRQWRTAKPMHWVARDKLPQEELLRSERLIEVHRIIDRLIAAGKP